MLAQVFSNVAIGLEGSMGIVRKNFLFQKEQLGST